RRRAGGVGGPWRGAAIVDGAEPIAVIGARRDAQVGIAGRVRRQWREWRELARARFAPEREAELVPAPVGPREIDLARRDYLRRQVARGIGSAKQDEAARLVAPVRRAAAVDGAHPVGVRRGRAEAAVGEGGDVGRQDGDPLVIAGGALAPEGEGELVAAVVAPGEIDLI